MNDSLEEVRLTQALEAVPTVTVPQDFALRVMGRLPPVIPGKHVARLFVPSTVAVGRRVGFAALLVLAVLMLALAPWSLVPWSPSVAGNGHWGLKAAEWIFCGEFVGLTLWMGRQFGFNREL